MSRLLPLFPLNLVVFPGEKLNLHIFEQRYKDLIQDCHLEGITFGISAYIDDKLQEVGTEIKLSGIEKMYPDGKMDIRTEGIGLFKIIDFHKVVEGKLYPGATILDLDFENESGSDENRKRIFDQIAELFGIMKIDKSLPKNYHLLETFRIAQKVGFNIQQKYEMLKLPTEIERQNYMIHHLDNLLPMVKEMESLRQRIQMNGHFKNIIPPNV